MEEYDPSIPVELVYGFDQKDKTAKIFFEKRICPCLAIMCMALFRCYMM